jgi:hypothetical protein
MYGEVVAEGKRWVPGPEYEVGGRVGGRSAGFGVGARIDFARAANDNPGPIYQIK